MKTEKKLPEKYFYLALFILMGAIGTLSFSPFSYSFTIYLFPFFGPILIDRFGLKHSFLAGMFFGLGLWSVGGNWVYLAPFEIAGLNLYLSFFLAFLFIVFLSLFFGLPTLFYRLLKPFFPVWINRALFFPLFWILGELLRGPWFVGFPWFNFGYSHVDTHLNFLYPWVGNYGVGLLLTSFFGLMSFFLEKRILLPPLIGGILVLSFSFKIPTSSQKRVEKPLEKLALVQTGEEYTKWEMAEQWNYFLKRNLSLWEKADITIWPETFLDLYTIGHKQDPLIEGKGQYKKDVWEKVPVKISNKQANFFFIRPIVFNLLEPLMEVAKEKKKVIFFGAKYKEVFSGKMINALFSLGPEGLEAHIKEKLVPYGERLPINKEWAIWKLLNFNDPNFRQGDGNDYLLSSRTGSVSGLICFEANFMAPFLKQAKQSKFFVISSKDTMFNNSLQPFQQQQIIRVRALETGRWIARTSTTGISSLINPKGKVVLRSQGDGKEILTGKIALRTETTPLVNLFLFFHKLLGN